MYYLMSTEVLETDYIVHRKKCSVCTPSVFGEIIAQYKFCLM